MQIEKKNLIKLNVSYSPRAERRRAGEMPGRRDEVHPEVLMYADILLQDSCLYNRAAKHSVDE